MRTWTILSLDGSTVGDIEAASLSLRDDGIAQFFDEGTNLVGLVRDWQLIRTEPQEEQAPTRVQPGMRIVTDPSIPNDGRMYVLDPSQIIHQDMVTGEDTEAIKTLRQQASDGPTYTPEADFDEAIAERRERLDQIPPSLARGLTAAVDQERELLDAAEAHHRAQTSAPDEQGVSTDPIPEPEPALVLDDVDANPAGSPEAESTGESSPPAAPGPTVVYEGNETRAPDTTRTELSRLYTSLRATPILRAFVAKQEAENLPVKVGDLTVEQREAAITWLKNPPAEVTGEGDDA